MTSALTSRVELEGPGAVPRATVPWTTVLTLGALLAYTDGFWTTVLREAVGSIERAGDPFFSWLRESTSLVPLFAVAVLAALGIARSGGPVAEGRRLLLVGPLVAVAATLAGVAELAFSSWFDYRLQLSGLDRMGTMGGRCVGECLQAQRDATLSLQLRSVLYGSAILLAANLLVVAWALALAGGRLRLERMTHRPAHARDRNDDLRVLGAVCLGGSALVHLSVVPQHLVEWPAAGLFFVALAALQLWAADRWVTLPGVVTGSLVVAVSAGPLGLHAWSRVWGLPLGPAAGEPETVGLADATAGVLEAVVLVCLVLLVAERAAGRQSPVGAHAGWVAVLLVVAVTSVGVGAGFGLYGGPGGHEAPAHVKTSPPSHLA